MTPVTRLTPEIRDKYASRRGALSGAVAAAVDQILADFRKDPDGTIRALTKKFDKVDLATCAGTTFITSVETSGARPPGT